MSASSPTPSRLSAQAVAPDAVAAIAGLERYLRRSALPPALLELVKLRASYINGCAFCVDMHTRDARAAGETEQRLFAVPVWRETPFFSPSERVALAWTEALTRLAEHGVSDDLYGEARELFSERDLVDLTLAVIAINAWNRLAVSFAALPGSYRPAPQEAR